MTSVARTLAQELPRLHEGAGGDATQLSAAAEHAVGLLRAVTLLKRFDENKDMKITLKEVTSTLKSMPVPAAFASTFIKAAGKDGAVSLEEFKKFVNDSNNEKYINSMHNAYKLMAVADSATPTVSKPEPKNPMNSWEK